MMVYEHIPPEYQNSAVIQAAAERAAAIEYLALQPPAQGDPAIMQLIQRDEAEQAESRRRILGVLIEQGGNAGHYNKASIMLQVAASIRLEEKPMLEDNTFAGAGRTIAIERGLRYFANHPETFLAELRDPNPPPALDPSQGFLGHVLTRHLYADPSDAGAHSRIQDLPAPLALAYFGIVNCWLFARNAPTERPQLPQAANYYLDAAAAWNRLGGRLSGAESTPPPQQTAADWPPPWPKFLPETPDR